MNLFNSIKIKNPKRNKFNLSHQVKLTTEFGRLAPILCEPVLPADKFNLSTTLKVQFAPMTFPVMERFKAYVHYWFVPNRLLWDSWEDFITGGESGIADQSLSYPVIACDHLVSGDSVLASNFGTGSLFDYLGFPAKELTETDLTNITRNPVYFDALPFKAYQFIWSEFYRDQNIEPEFDLMTNKSGNQDNDDDGAFVNGLMSLRYRCWKKDYFTSALPDPQRGPDVTLPLLGDIDIVGNRATIPVYSTQGYKVGSQANTFALKSHASGGDTQFLKLSENVVSNDDNVGIKGGFGIDTAAENLSISSEQRSATINEVRRGFALQRLYELAARVGGRYAENIFGNFGVHAGDARLQRPEFLGGSVVPIMVGDVLQTSETGETPLGMPAGVAGGVGSSREFSKTFYEHGWIIGILSIMPEATYMQGLPRKFSKRSRLDFAWPLLANLGEQEIMNGELYFDYSDSDGNIEGFGYAPRYSEYKFAFNQVHGDFRTTLADFHDARIFESRPALNAEFLKVKPTSNHEGLNRIFAVNDADYDHIWVNLINTCIVRRKLPKYGTPI